MERYQKFVMVVVIAIFSASLLYILTLPGGIVGSSKLAENEYQKAAEQGDADAQYFLGFMYYKGQGVTQDYKKATHWFLAASEQGIAEAQKNLGLHTL